jgi:hypothetical protein
MIDLSVPPLEHFAKRAKELHVQVRAGDAGAQARVRSIYNDLSALTPTELSQSFGLMRAQHIVAVEHGFANWKAIAESPGVEARLAITMARHPDLNDFGIGLSNIYREETATEKRARFDKNRARLRASVAGVMATAEWLRENIAPTKTINKRHTSYGLKHVAEHDIGYITNGVFIAAGIITGYPYEILPFFPNVPFGMSEKSFREASLRRRFPERVLKQFIPNAVRILRKRGVLAFPVGRSGIELAWLDSGDVRTLRIDAYVKEPFIVRLYIDHYSIFVSPRVARALRIEGGRYAQAEPTRPKEEITVVMDEVIPALEWALGHDARPNVPPFETSNRNNPGSYVWSKRAATRDTGPCRKGEDIGGNSVACARIGDDRAAQARNLR